MRRQLLMIGLVGLGVVMAPLTASSAENVNLEKIEYQDWSRPKMGDPLPVGGPVVRVYSEGGDRFDFVGHTNEPLRFLGLLSGACARVNKISYLQFRVGEQVASVSHPSDRGAWFSRTGIVDVPHHDLQGFDAVRACNDGLTTFVAETGRSRGDLVAEGFGIRFPDWIEGRAVLMCTGRDNSDSATARFAIWVHCVGNPKSGEQKPAQCPVVPPK